MEYADRVLTAHCTSPSSLQAMGFSSAAAHIHSSSSAYPGLIGSSSGSLPAGDPTAAANAAAGSSSSAALSPHGSPARRRRTGAAAPISTAAANTSVAAAAVATAANQLVLRPNSSLEPVNSGGSSNAAAARRSTDGGGAISTLSSYDNAPTSPGSSVLPTPRRLARLLGSGAIRVSEVVSHPGKGVTAHIPWNSGMSGIVAASFTYQQQQQQHLQGGIELGSPTVAAAGGGGSSSKHMLHLAIGSRLLMQEQGVGSSAEAEAFMQGECLLVRSA